MLKQVRIEAGLGNQPNKFDNRRAESINNISKDFIGNQYKDQSAVHDIVMCQPPAFCLNQIRWVIEVIPGFRILLQHSNLSAQRLLNLK